MLNVFLKQYVTSLVPTKPNIIFSCCIHHTQLQCWQHILWTDLDYIGFFVFRTTVFSCGLYVYSVSTSCYTLNYTMTLQIMPNITPVKTGHLQIWNTYANRWPSDRSVNKFIKKSLVKALLESDLGIRRERRALFQQRA